MAIQQALIVGPGGRRIDFNSMKKRLATPGVGSTGISATLPSGTLPVLPDIQTQDGAGKALMSINAGGTQDFTMALPSTLEPGLQANVFGARMGLGADAMSRSRQGMAATAPAEGIAANEFTARQAGTLQVTPEHLAKLTQTDPFPVAAGFGAGSQIPVDAYLRVRAEEAAQRQANVTGVTQVAPGGLGGRPGCGGKAIQTFTSPSYAEVESDVGGKKVGLPEPVHARWAKIQETLNAAIVADWAKSQEVGGISGDAPPPPGPITNALAYKQARDALGPEDKAFLAMVERVAKPEEFGYREVTSERGRVTNTGQKLGRMFTTAEPHPLSPAAGKKPAKAVATLTGQVRRDIQITDKLLGGGRTSAAVVEKHLTDILSRSPEDIAQLVTDNPNFAAYAALLGRGHLHGVAMHEAYKLKEEKGVKPHITDSEAIKLSREQLYGVPKLERYKDPETEAWTERQTGWLVSPWNITGTSKTNMGKGITDKAALKKAIGERYDDLVTRLRTYNLPDDRIGAFFNSVVYDALPKDTPFTAEEKLFWKDIKKARRIPVSVGDMSADALKQHEDAKARGTVTSAADGGAIPGPSPRPKPEPETGDVRLVNSILGGKVEATARNWQEILAAFVQASKSGKLTPAQKKQLEPTMKRLLEFKNTAGAQ